MRSSSLVLLIMLTFVQKSRRPCYLLILGSTTLYRGAQIVTLVMPIRYLQPIPFLDTRLDNSRCFSNPSRRHTSSTSSFLCQCRHGLGIHRLGFYKRRGSSTFTFYIFESHITFRLLQGQSQEVGHLFGCVGPEMKASRHIITSTRAIYQHQSAILHLLCRNYDFRNKKKQKHQEKFEKMSDDEAKGLRSELGTLAVFLTLNPNNKKQSPKKLKKLSDDEAKGLRSELSTLAVLLALNPSNKKQSPKKQYRTSGRV